MSANLICPNCGFADNPASTRFCGNCAARLPLPCPVCGAINPQGFRFCGQCATPLNETTTLQSLHRVVTVLFVDICNSTSFTNLLGAERMYTMLDACLRQLSMAVRRFEGTIDKMTGDGLMAVFGMPTTLEQHAIQGAFAAFAMMEELERFNQQYTDSAGIDFEVRIGMASGEAVSGGLGSDRSKDVTVIGEVVNLAARLQQHGTPNTITVDQRAAQFVSPLFEISPLPPLTLKGFSEPTPAFRLEGRRALPGLLRGLGGQLTPMVGRRTEMDQLEAAFNPLVEGLGGAILLTGEAGIGKSRITNEVLERVKQRGLRILEGDCFSHTRTVPYNVFMGVIRDFCGLLPTDNRAEVRLKINEAVLGARVRPDIEIVPYLEYLLSIDLVDESLLERVRHLDPAQLKRQLFRAIRELILAETRHHPLVLVLDDLQWADELSTELILYLAQSLDRATFMMYLIARGDYQPHQRLMFTELLALVGERGLEMHLAPLSQDELREMAHTLLPEAVNGTVDHLVEHAEGVPYYLEELVRHTLEAPDSESVVPTSLEALIRARYDRLPEPLQVTLAKAAIIGRRFAIPLLNALQGESTQQELKQLHDRAFVRPRRANEDEWSFVHILMQETIYKSLLARQRRQLHEQVGKALERLAGDRLDEQVAVLAFHFSRSDDTDKALLYLLRAAARAAGRFANDEALRLYQEAKGLLDDYPARYHAERVAVVSGRADVLKLRGQYDEARDAYEQALALVPSLEEANPVLQASLERRLAETFEKQNRYAEAKEHLIRARAALGEGDPMERARINSDAGWVAFLLGELEEAEALYRAALSEGEERLIQAQVYNRLAGICFQRGELDMAEEMLRHSLALSRAVNDQSAMALTLGNLGIVAQNKNDWQAAESYYIESKNIYVRSEDVVGQLRTNSNAATAAYMRGQFDTAMETLNEVYSLAQQVAIKNYVGVARFNQGRIALFEGNLALARRYFIEAWCAYRTVNSHKANRADLLELLGRVALKQGKLYLALLLGRRALALAERIQATSEAFRARRLLALVHSAAGRFDRASEMLAELKDDVALNDQYEMALLLLVEAAHLTYQGLPTRAAGCQEEAALLFEQNGVPPALRKFM